MQTLLDFVYGIIVSAAGLFVENPAVWLQTGTNGHPPPLIIILFLLGSGGMILGWYMASYLRFVSAVIIVAVAFALLYGLIMWNTTIIGISLLIMVLTFVVRRDPQYREDNERMMQANRDYRDLQKRNK